MADPNKKSSLSTRSSPATSSEPTSSTPEPTAPTSPNEPITNGDTTADGRVVIPESLPILPIRGTVVFPGTIMPLGIGRASSKKLLEESLPTSKIIGLFTQRDDNIEDPNPSQLYEIGCAAMVLKLIRQPDDTVSIIVHGLTRVRMGTATQIKPYMRASVQRLNEKPVSSGKSMEALLNSCRDQARKLMDLLPNVPEQAQQMLLNIEEPSNLADFLAANFGMDLAQKQDLLEELDIGKRLRRVHYHVSHQLEIARLQDKIQTDVQSSITDTQRKIFLREQVKAIQKELGEGADSNEQTIEELKKKLADAKPPEKVMAEAQRELNRLSNMHPASPEYSLALTYLELVADLPWNLASSDNLDLRRAQRILDRDHFGLNKVKKRLIEYLAVRKLNPAGRGPILCLVGPPGVGKTSLGQSVADALGRKFVRMSLGGIRDEAEVRGHRRTYIGAMPGRIVQELRRAKTNNPVMMLDELDKLGSDFRGDPASALLEVLDPRQNNAFVDRYLDVPFDLSQVMFIATANYMGTVPAALRDRMEVIEIPGYTDFDKIRIAEKYLVPRQIKENGLPAKRVAWTTTALRKTIDDYTREAGVRELERQIGAVCRGMAAEFASGKTPRGKMNVTPDRVRSLLGPERYFRELDEQNRQPGLVVGLAYTSVGGEILFIEATRYAGKGRLTLTGQIGDVMKESVTAAMSLIKSHADKLGIDLEELSKLDLHVHVPAGAVPKDGPSAGVAMYTSLVSLLLDLPVVSKLGMTGEITLRGRVLPIGGVKEKTLAAVRAGLTTVLLPEQNRRDEEEMDPKVRRQLKRIYVSQAEQVLQHAFGKERLAKAIEAAKRRLAKKQAAFPAGEVAKEGEKN